MESKLLVVFQNVNEWLRFAEDKKRNDYRTEWCNYFWDWLKLLI